MTRIDRRVFVKGGAISLLALGLPPAFLQRAFAAETARSGRKTLVTIFQRGAVDGLNMVVPFGEEAYYRMRGSIAVPAPGTAEQSALDLDGFFGLHPSLAPLHELWGRGEMAIVHAVGSPHPTRSHFEAQDYMESATPGVSARDGWLNRVLEHSPCSGCDGRVLADGPAHAADHAVGQVALTDSPFRAVAMTRALPRSLQGRMDALAIADLARFGVADGRDPSMASAFERMYRTPEGDAVSAAGSEAFDAIAVLRSLRPEAYRPREGVQYPPGAFGTALRQIAQLIKADLGVEIAFADIGGWDTHVNQGGSTGQLATRFSELSRGLRAFHDDLGDRMEDVVVLTMSEFGRTARENGSGGTDHGHANCMLALGGAVHGGTIHGVWPGLEPEQLNENRDLARTSDFRDVFAEVASRHLGAERLDLVFPGHTLDPARYHGLL